MNKFAMVLALAGALHAEVIVPEGTAVRVRLDNQLNSSTAQQGQMVDFVVVDEVRIGETVVIESGARATGTVILAEGRKNMGRAGKLDFTIDKVRTVDGRQMDVRPTKQGRDGKGSTVRTGLIAAGVAMVFWPAAPFVLLHKGKDAEVARGSMYTVYTDVLHTVHAPGTQPTSAAPVAKPATLINTASESRSSSATLQIDADSPGAEIELDGKFVGNTPSTVTVAPGLHLLTIRDGSLVWMREVDLQRGASANIKARMVPAAPERVIAGANLK